MRMRDLKLRKAEAHTPLKTCVSTQFDHGSACHQKAKACPSGCNNRSRQPPPGRVQLESSTDTVPRGKDSPRMPLGKLLIATAARIALRILTHLSLSSEIATGCGRCSMVTGYDADQTIAIRAAVKLVCTSSGRCE